MSIQEKFTSFTGQVSERIQDPETQARLRGVARVAGNLALEGALGESGLDIMKTGRNGEQKIKKVKAARVAFRALRNPLGVAQKAGRGVVDEARSAVRSSGFEAVRKIVDGSSSGETANNLFSTPSSNGSAPEDNFRNVSFSKRGEQVDDGYDSEDPQSVSMRAERIIRGLGKLGSENKNVGSSFEGHQAIDLNSWGPGAPLPAPGEQLVYAPSNGGVPAPTHINNEKFRWEDL